MNTAQKSKHTHREDVWKHIRLSVWPRWTAVHVFQGDLSQTNNPWDQVLWSQNSSSRQFLISTCPQTHIHTHPHIQWAKMTFIKLAAWLPTLGGCFKKVKWCSSSFFKDFIEESEHRPGQAISQQSWKHISHSRTETSEVTFSLYGKHSKHSEAEETGKFVVQWTVKQDKRSKYRKWFG